MITKANKKKKKRRTRRDSKEAKNLRRTRLWRVFVFVDISFGHIECNFIQSPFTVNKRIGQSLKSIKSFFYNF